MGIAAASKGSMPNDLVGVAGTGSWCHRYEVRARFGSESAWSLTGLLETCMLVLFVVVGFDVALL